MEDLNSTHSQIGRSSWQKFDEEIQALNDTLDQMDLNDIHRSFYPKMAAYTFFWNADRTFSRIYCMLGHKVNLCKFKKIEMLSSIFSDHNAMRFEISYSKNLFKKNQKHVTAKHATKQPMDH